MEPNGLCVNTVIFSGTEDPLPSQRGEVACDVPYKPSGVVRSLCFSVGIKIEDMRARNVASIAREGEHKPHTAALGGQQLLILYLTIPHRAGRSKEELEESVTHDKQWEV